MNTVPFLLAFAGFFATNFLITILIFQTISKILRFQGEIELKKKAKIDFTFNVAGFAILTPIWIYTVKILSLLF